MWAYFAVAAWRVVALLEADCGPEDDRSPCQPAALRLTEWAPFYGALLGLVVAVVGCWVWPRRHRPVWLGIGYIIAVIGSGIGASVAA